MEKNHFQRYGQDLLPAKSRVANYLSVAGTKGFPGIRTFSAKTQKVPANPGHVVHIQLKPGTVSILGLKGHENRVVTRTQRGKVHGDGHLTRVWHLEEG